MKKSTKIGIVILVTFIVFNSIPPYILAGGTEKIENWDNYIYWINYPKKAYPEWLAFKSGLSKTKIYQGEGRIRFSYIIENEPPKDILIETEEGAQVNISIKRPDGLTIELSTTVLENRTTFNSNPDLSIQIYSFGMLNLGLLSTDRVLFTPTQVIFIGKDRKSLSGTYIFTFNSTKPLKITVFGSTYGILGTDKYGRDLWVGFVLASRETLLLALVVSLFVLSFGLLLGIFAGYYESAIGNVADYVLNALTSAPFLPLAIVMTFAFSGISFYMKLSISPLTFSLILAVLIVGKFARAIKGIVKREKVQEFITASKALGASDYYIIRKHILKAVIPYSINYFTLLYPKVVALISILGFFNVIAGTNWGSYIAEAFEQGAFYGNYWWWILSPGFAMALLSIGMTLISMETKELKRIKRLT